MRATKNEAAGFTAYSVEDTAAAINRYGNQNGSIPISVSIVQEGEGSSATIKAIAVFAPLRQAQPVEAAIASPNEQAASASEDSWGEEEAGHDAR